MFHCNKCKTYTHADNRTMRKKENALEALKAGKFIVVYDGDEREGEADIMFHAKFATATKIEKLRKEAGGLICLAIDKESAKNLSFLFFTEILRKAKMENISCTKTAYGDQPAFALPINHKKVYTGISDEDRALTIKEMEKIINFNSKNMRNEFEKNFYSPGHIFILIGRGIEERKGHTELGLELTKNAGLSSAIVMCEMLGKGKALSKNQAKKYAKRNNFPFLEGREIVPEIQANKKKDFQTKDL